MDYKANIFIVVAFTVIKTLLLLPLCVPILYLGSRHWLQQRSFAASSHSDIFCYNMMVVELISLVGWSLFCYGSYVELSWILSPGYYIMLIALPGQILFHCLTCVERYLAVVHPITYLALRNTAGMRIRNVGVGCVWLLCFTWTGIAVLYYPILPFVPFFCILGFSLIVVSFCSLSVLCVLIRPGPGEGGGNREQVDQLKRRAVVTLTAIMGVLLLHFVGFVVCFAVRVARLLSNSDGCVLTVCAIWFSLPTSLLLPLLLLHRAAKLASPRGNMDSRAT